MALDAERSLRSHRGGPELLATITEGASLENFIIDVLADDALWGAFIDEELVGFVIARRGVVEALYVVGPARRRGVARSMLTTLLALSDPPKDAYALPGDRATKSIYESIGWKARLLTMRGE
jgi:GNAT superfamily N-acetyltransferase